jgi:hypothetical protein
LGSDKEMAMRKKGRRFKGTTHSPSILPIKKHGKKYPCWDTYNFQMELALDGCISLPNGIVFVFILPFGMLLVNVA